MCGRAGQCGSWGQAGRAGLASSCRCDACNSSLTLRSRSRSPKRAPATMTRAARQIVSFNCKITANSNCRSCCLVPRWHLQALPAVQLVYNQCLAAGLICAGQTVTDHGPGLCIMVLHVGTDNTAPSCSNPLTRRCAGCCLCPTLPYMRSRSMGAKVNCDVVAPATSCYIRAHNAPCLQSLQECFQQCATRA
jgi:hypothetical protein